MNIIVTSDITLLELLAQLKEIIKVGNYDDIIDNVCSLHNDGIIEGKLEMEDGNIKMRVAGSGGNSGASSTCKLPLSRGKCEELANYYLGFNGWTSEMMYHKKEELEDNTSCYVTVVKLSFPQVYQLFTNQLNN